LKVSFWMQNYVMMMLLLTVWRFLDAKLCDDDDDAHDTLTQKARLGSNSKNYSSLGGGKRLSPQGGGGWPLNSRKMKQQKYP
jgi:hypothetical protein